MTEGHAIGINKKGFLLFEVVVSIAIITTGLLFITRSFSSAKDSIQKSTHLFETSLLLESKMWEFEEKGKIEEDFLDSGEFPENEEYSWKIEARRIDEESDLNLVTLQAYKEKAPAITKYSLSTYLENKK